MEMNPATLWEAISDAVPERDALVHTGRRMTWHQFDDNPGRDLDYVRSIGSAATMFFTEVKAELLAHLPQAMILDCIGASEGAIGLSLSTKDSVAQTGQFRPNRGVIVVDDNGERVPAEPGNIGLVASPSGGEEYYKDAAKSATAFRMIDGEQRGEHHPPST